MAKFKPNLLDRFASTLDRSLGVLAPGREVKRLLQREAARQLRGRQYAAAKTTRLTGSWMPIDQEINTLIASSSPAVRARVMQLVRDFPYFSRAVKILVNLTVGKKGIQFQSSVNTPAGDPDEKARTQIEEAWRRWSAEADVANRLSLAGMARLAKRQELEAGEFLLLKVLLTDKQRYIPFGLQAVEAAWLSDIGARLQSGNKIHQGIEYEPNSGRIVAYHLAIPEKYGISKRIEAQDVVHGFETLRPGQLRGISPFASAVLLAHDLGDYMDAEMDAAKMAAKWLAIVKTADPLSFQANRVKDDKETGQKIEELENAIIEYLRPGEEITLSSHNRPGESFGPYVKLVLRMIAVAIDVSYELLSGDYDGISYSNLRGIRNDLAQQIEPHQERHISQFYQPVFEAFLDYAVLAGRVNLPNYWRDRARYLSCDWIPPGMESPDPLRESKAYRDDIAAGLRSPQEMIRRRGRDPETVLDEIAHFNRVAKDKGVTLSKGSTSLANNPASLGAEE